MHNLGQATRDYYNMVCAFMKDGNEWIEEKCTNLRHQLQNHSRKTQENMDKFIELGNKLKKYENIIDRIYS
jgi:hypothetical protein